MLPAVALFSDSPSSDLRQALADAGYQVGCHDLNGDSLNGQALGLLVVEGGVGVERAVSLCRRLRTHQGEGFTPILFITPDAAPATRLACLEGGADTSLMRPFAGAELLAQVQALVRIKERHDQLAAKTSEVHRINKRLQAAYQQIDMELDLARRIQESFLPQSLPSLPNVRFAVKYRPCGRVGGDFYDVFRLDEQHLGFYVADAMGHGVPASLLTIFVKTSVKAKEISAKSYRLVPPNEVLQRLNRDLIGQHLQENPFITLVYGLFNFKEGVLSFSRAGHPYPLHIPREGPPQLLQMEGSLLGVFDTTYRLKTSELKPGDKLILYTDGMDAAAYGASAVGIPSLLAAAQSLREMPVDDLVEHLATDLFTQTKQSDDLTILGMEVLASS